MKVYNIFIREGAAGHMIAHFNTGHEHTLEQEIFVSLVNALLPNKLTFLKSLVSSQSYRNKNEL